MPPAPWGAKAAAPPRHLAPLPPARDCRVPAGRGINPPFTTFQPLDTIMLRCWCFQANCTSSGGSTRNEGQAARCGVHHPTQMHGVSSCKLAGR